MTKKGKAPAAPTKRDTGKMVSKLLPIGPDAAIIIKLQTQTTIHWVVGSAITAFLLLCIGVSYKSIDDKIVDLMRGLSSINVDAKVAQANAASNDRLDQKIEKMEEKFDSKIQALENKIVFPIGANRSAEANGGVQ